MTVAYHDRIIYCPACHKAHRFVVRVDLVPDFSDPEGEDFEFQSCYGYTCQGFLCISPVPAAALESAVHQAMSRQRA